VAAQFCHVNFSTNHRKSPISFQLLPSERTSIFSKGRTGIPMIAERRSDFSEFAQRIGIMLDNPLSKKAITGTTV